MLDCQRWEEVRFVATSLCSIVKNGKKYDLLPPVCAQRWEEVLFVATSLRSSIVKDGREYDLLPPVCARLSKMGRSTVCCHQFAVLDCQRWEEVRFVSTSWCSIVKDGKKYGLLPPVCAQRWEEVRFVATSLSSIAKDGKNYDLLPPVCGPRLSKIGINKYDVLPPVCAQRWEEVRFVATSLCSIVKNGKKYDLLPPDCARLSKMGRSTFFCHQFAVLDCLR